MSIFTNEQNSLNSNTGQYSNRAKLFEKNHYNDNRDYS
jgi:hypothetical protein